MTIKEIRQKHSLTQAQLADIIGVSKRNIENWEGGKRECKPYLTNLIAFYLDNANWRDYTNMTINDYLRKYPAGTAVEIYYHHNDNHRRYHPDFVEPVEVDDKILNHPFRHLSVELFDKEEYLSRWDICGYMDPDCVDDNTLICFIYNAEYYEYIEAMK